ncbi:TIGR03986 family CRISPR-associated RAMP protein [Geitlerinema sp. P-1104]|uniref:TIGR03986 family type III CRISPR-associated RAMP protein n=1 Tax=Geitlerinema sp. P-1104 TaxID=2546230 RepID=UPI00147726E8|nr:TIGR03986 family CRISPR-associated RAMP protein [Geitlerinema sp. P-1104]NMG59189.1 TIGR03986 family CRISPR-associated RAMP protein [Geitlerinema sp. P-1104]
MSVLKGELRVGNNGSIQLRFQDENQTNKTIGIGNKILTKSFYNTYQENPQALDRLEVEFELDNNQPCRVREVGGVFRDTPKPKTVRPQWFHNPYNFVPALPRNNIAGELGDRKPIGHGRYHANHWTGRIAVKLTTITPLLIPDASEMKEDAQGHKTFPTRLDAQGKPYLPPTSLRGMLRSAYEAVTNSRLSVLDPHDMRLAYRMPAQMGLQMVPARIENNEIKLYPGTSGIGSDGRPQGPMYAAWLPFYNRSSTQPHRKLTYPDGSLPQHGDAVDFWAEKFEKQNANGGSIFSYWKVRKIVKSGGNLGTAPNRSSGSGRHQSVGQALRQFSGFVYITNKNIDGKHDERVFFSEDEPISCPLSNDLRTKWKELITNYQEIHKDDLRKGWTSPPALNNSCWSRQVISGAAERQLSEGSLCYAKTRNQGQRCKVDELYPVMITRGLFNQAPISLLHSSLKPATQADKSQLSPADRVFGWVNQQGKGSYKGQLRIHSVTCQSDDPLDDFSRTPVPLAILGQPKPQQAGFYSAKNDQGDPLNIGSSKNSGYNSDSQGLRGRKVYIHHQGLPNGHWDNPQQDNTQNAVQGHYQEYRRPQQNGVEQKDDQNRSLKSWVKVGTEFTFDIDVVNLSEVELGGLLYLLTLPDIHFHRLGGGKPLGFGSVRLDLIESETDLRPGQDWSEFYQTLLPDEVVVKPINVSQCVKAYQKSVEAAYGGDFEDVRFVAAFCRAAKGFDDRAAVRYPRVSPHPTPEGEAFKWFVENERESKNESGMKLTLPDLADPAPDSFPIQPTTQS